MTETDWEAALYWKARAETAEARITLAMGIVHGYRCLDNDLDLLGPHEVALVLERALTEGAEQQPTPEKDTCKYPTCSDKLMTGHYVSDSYFDNDPDDETPWPMLHGSTTTGNIHIHAVRMTRWHEGTT